MEEMNTIKRDVYVLRNTIKIPIEVTKGTDAISFEFTVRDYNLPATAAAVAYAYRMGMKKPNSTLCDVSGNAISFQPSANFFEVGNNELQIRVINEDKSLISFKEKVKCSDSMGFPDEEEEADKSLIEQIIAQSGKESGERKAADTQERAERIEADAKEKSERLKEIATERARIDQLTKMGEGSTTGDAELADIRVGNEGATYSNAGNAVRSQTKDVPAMMDNLQSPYVDISLLEQGSLNNTGTEITSSKVLRSVEFHWNKNGRITAPSGYKIAIANYAMQSDESGQMLQVYQSATDYGDNQTSSKADGDTEFRRLLIKRSDGADINAEDLRGKITTNVPGLRAMDVIENLEKKIKTDTTLEKEGVAADAAETGKRISKVEGDIGFLSEFEENLFYFPSCLKTTEYIFNDYGNGVMRLINDTYHDGAMLTSGDYYCLIDFTVTNISLVESKNGIFIVSIVDAWGKRNDCNKRCIIDKDGRYSSGFVKINFANVNNLKSTLAIVFDRNYVPKTSCSVTINNAIILKNPIDMLLIENIGFSDKYPQLVLPKDYFLKYLDLYGISDELLEIKKERIDYNIFEQAYIKDCALISNNLNSPSANNIACYTVSKMPSKVKTIKAKVKFYGGASAAIISEPNGQRFVTDVTNMSVHIVFSKTGVTIGYFTNRKLNNTKRIEYTIDEDTEYAVGFTLDEKTKTFIIHLPTGEDYDVGLNHGADVVEKYINSNGNYALWEHYINTSSQDFSSVKFTKFWCEDDSGNVLCDEFKRNNGFIGYAPQGYIYGQFSCLNQQNWVF